MSETTERATGATDEQIEAAVERHWQEILEERPDATRTPTYTYEIKREIAGIACYLVPPGYRIVPADAVLTDEEADAIASWVDDVDEAIDYYRFCPYPSKTALATLRRIVARGGG